MQSRFAAALPLSPRDVQSHTAHPQSTCLVPSKLFSSSRKEWRPSSARYFRPDDRNPKGHPMTSYLPVALTSPVEWFVASTRVAGPLADARPGWVGPGKDHSGLWLRNATAGLCVLAAAAAVVSFTAQYRMVDATRHLAVIAALEAAIP